MGLFKSRGKHAQKATKANKAAEASSEEAASEGAVVSSCDETPDDERTEALEAEAGAETAPGQGSTSETDAEQGSESADENGSSSGDGDGNAGDGNASDGFTSAETAAMEGVVVESIGGEGADGFVAAGFGEIPTKKRRRALKAFGITVGVLAVVVLAAYIAGAIVFMGRFLPNTVIGGNDISLKTDAEVEGILEGIVDDYRLDVVGNGFSYRMTGEDVGLSIDADGIVKAIHSDLNAWMWPALIVRQKHDETDQLAVTYKRTAFEPDLTDAVDEYNETAKAPVDATIVYEEESDEFVVKPEEAGTQLDSLAVVKAVSRALSDLGSKVSLGDEQLVQPKVFSTDEKLIEAAELATGMISAKLTLVMDGKSVGEVNGDMLSSFVTVDDKFEVTFKEDELDAWVGELAADFNTVGTERTYTRADGKAIAVSGGVYGWEIDAEALKDAVLEGIRAGSTADVEVPCSGVAETYNGPNQRDWGDRYVDVDITEQHVRFYGDDGAIIWEADCITGEPDGKHDTVKGVWMVNAKESPSKLIGYENGKKIYETKVTFWMPFEGNGIGFHDATWQPSFGGAMYANGYGSHGCVNLSYSDAEELYGIIEEGDVVVVHA